MESGPHRHLGQKLEGSQPCSQHVPSEASGLRAVGSGRRVGAGGCHLLSLLLPPLYRSSSQSQQRKPTQLLWGWVWGVAPTHVSGSFAEEGWGVLPLGTGETRALSTGNARKRLGKSPAAAHWRHLGEVPGGAGCHLKVGTILCVGGCSLTHRLLLEGS